MLLETLKVDDTQQNGRRSNIQPAANARIKSQTAVVYVPRLFIVRWQGGIRKKKHLLTHLAIGASLWRNNSQQRDKWIVKEKTEKKKNFTHKHTHTHSFSLSLQQQKKMGKRNGRENQEKYVCGLVTSFLHRHQGFVSTKLTVIAIYLFFLKC